MSCQECSNPSCTGREQLRHFADWDDLASHLSEEKIVEFVNRANELLEQRASQGKRWRRKQQLLARAAKELLDRDELEAIGRISQDDK